ncbi:calmodulin-lysine N-methyltransferase [Anabrus simplex]|uniref:calmodulin-lysine N-methyltransferase n=1 Tax=Anabrus simplex TaxID=316456 RepID=UPI0034DDBCAC
MSTIVNGSHQQLSKRNEVARRRWKILARALSKNIEADVNQVNDYDISVRRVTSFNLFNCQPTAPKISTEDPSVTWFEYSTTISQETYVLNIRHPMRNFTAVELMGFNNTGNICIWPSEEVLAYFALCNLDIFAGKSILELGGGMTCLAGLMIAKYSAAVKIHLTDGNVAAVDNVKYIINENGFGKGDYVTFSVLEWGDFREKVTYPHKSTYDIILSADCLFFDEVREDLVETIWATLNENGVAFVMAPQRGETFDKFAQEAKLRGFKCKIKPYYNDNVWNKHLELKQSRDYDENIHYPKLLLLTKSYETNSHFQ